MEKVKLSPPWISFFREVEALFEEDPEIVIRYVEEPLTIKLYVNNEAKADALTQLLPTEKNFGGVTVYIQVIPADTDRKPNKAELFKAAYAGNPIFEEMIDVEGVFVYPIHYCVLEKKVVQYWNDNLADPNGNVSTLYQDIAKDVFGDTDSVIFCTSPY